MTPRNPRGAQASSNEASVFGLGLGERESMELIISAAMRRSVTICSIVPLMLLSVGGTGATTVSGKSLRG